MKQTSWYKLCGTHERCVMWNIFTKLFFSYWHSCSHSLADPFCLVLHERIWQQYRSSTFWLPHTKCMFSNWYKYFPEMSIIMFISMIMNKYFIKRSTIIASLKSGQSFMDVEGICMDEENATTINSVYHIRTLKTTH